MTKKSISQVQIVETYDENGELISSDNKITSFSYEFEPEYIKLYLSDIGKLNGLSPASNKVLLELIKSMSYNNIIRVYMLIKKMIANKLGITTHSVEKVVKVFIKKDFL